jgi:hypothetical protein
MSTKPTPRGRAQSPVSPFLDAARRVLDDHVEDRAPRRVRTRVGVAPRSPVRIQASVDPALRGRAQAASQAVFTVGSMAVGLAGTVARDVAREVFDVARQFAAALAPPSGTLATGRVPPGGLVRMPVVIENTTDHMVGDLAFAATELVSAGRAPIPRDAVSISPDIVDLDPHSEETVTVVVRVPATAEAGTYVGSLETHGKIPAQATLAVHVEES